jgi:DNA-binding HxlR family transcriptional regulator
VTRRELEAVGLIHREVYAVVPPKVDYSLTDQGPTLEPVVRLMQDWGVKHLGQIEQTMEAAPREE